MGERLRKFWERPHEYEGKIIHVGTPGIFHRPHPHAALSVTFCGRDATDARATDHKLLDCQPCIVCFAPSGAGAEKGTAAAEEYEARMTCADCGQYGDGCRCGEVASW